MIRVDATSPAYQRGFPGRHLPQEGKYRTQIPGPFILCSCGWRIAQIRPGEMSAAREEFQRHDNEMPKHQPEPAQT